MTDTENKPPNLTLINTQPDMAVALSRADAALTYRLRCLAANLLRIVAGAGKPHRLMSEIEEVLRAAKAVRDASGCLDDIQAALDIVQLMREREEARFVPAKDRERHYAAGRYQQEVGLAQIRQGALRQVAAELLGQSTHSITAEHQIFTGINEVERSREQRERYDSDHRDEPSAIFLELCARSVSKSQVAVLRMIAPGEISHANKNSLRSLAKLGLIKQLGGAWGLTASRREAILYHDEKDAFESSQQHRD